MGLLKISPLGGCGEIGKNCTVIEQNGEIIIVDCGISFPHEEHHGVDVVIPDFSYLLENKQKIKAIILTHAHEDHIGALPYLLNELKAPIYCAQLTESFVRRKLDEKSQVKNPEFKPLKYGQKHDIGLFTVEPIRMTHSIPENSALAIWTEHGIILMSGDFKFDLNPVDRKVSDTKRLAEIGEEGILMLLCDSTNVLVNGWSHSESDVKPSLVEIMEHADGRVMVTTFSSQIHRMQQVADAAKETGRKISVAGRRMDMTFQMCRNLGYLHVQDDQYVPIEDITKYKPEELAILVTGSQGEQMAALSQMSRSEYTRLKIMEGDTIVYSARAIPGNEGNIWRTVNRLVKLGADVITDYRTPIHVSGHASAEEVKMLYRITQPFYVAPVHGEPRHQKSMNELLVKLGHPQHRIFIMENGDSLLMDDQKAWIGEPIPHGCKYLDQKSHKVIEESVLRDRTTLANEGVVAIAVAVDFKEGEIVGQPRLKVSGFVGGEEVAEDLLEDLCALMDRMDDDSYYDAKLFEINLTEVTRKLIWKRTSQKPKVCIQVISV